MTRARARFAALEDIMRKLLTVLILSFAVAAPAAQAGDFDRLFDSFGSHSFSRNDRVRELRRQKNAQRKLSNAQGKVAKECSYANPELNYYDCEIAKEELREAQRDANGWNPRLHNRRAFMGYQKRNSDRQRQFQAGMDLIDNLFRLAQ